VYAKNNSDGLWYQTTLDIPDLDTGQPQIRSFATHVDAVTGDDWAFAGESPSGIFHGLLSSKRGAGQNLINWATESENDRDYSGPPCNQPPRITSFAEAGGKLYAAICFQIGVRVDGPQASCSRAEVFIDGKCQRRWIVIWTDPTPSSSDTGLRGLTTVSYDGKDVLLAGEEGSKRQIYRIDPDTGVGFAELDLKSTLSFNWDMSLGYGIAPYSNMALWTDENGAGRRIIGMESFVGDDTPAPLSDRSFDMLEQGSKMEGDGWYIIRNAAVSYQLVHVPSDLLPTQMVAVRAFAQSPFADDCNAKGQACAIYVGGFDARAVSQRNESSGIPESACS
jgi:hypothetical protein